MIWLIGYKGMLGSEVARQLEKNHFNWIGTGSEIDITDYQSLEKFTQNIETQSYFPSKFKKSERQITWIINCAAYTNVDKAEEDIENAEKINEQGSLNIARIARKIGAKLIHISTDYVFDGSENTEYTEESQKSPLGIYGKTKSLGEDFIQKEMNTYYIIRTAWLYGFDGKNFVYTMTKAMNARDSVKVVNDQWGTPTFTVDLANAILKIIERTKKANALFGKNSIPSYGIYHFTDGGKTTWYEFAQEIYKFGKKYGRITSECKVEPCTTEEYGAKVKRPAYSVLSKEKICNELKIKLPDWKTSLEKFIKDSRFEVR